MTDEEARWAAAAEATAEVGLLPPKSDLKEGEEDEDEEEGKIATGNDEETSFPSFS